MRTHAKENASIQTEKNAYKVTYDMLFWLFLSGSVIGFFMEGAFCLITKGHWESHVVSVFGYYNILYGLGAILFFSGATVLRRYKLVVRVLLMTAAATVLELLCGLLLKYGLSMRAWNYENSFLNIDGIICPLFSFGWGIAALAFCLLYPKIYCLYSKLNGRTLHIVCIILTIIVAIDLCFTGVAIVRWSIRRRIPFARNAFERLLDHVWTDSWMQTRFVEWEFLS